jgi:hypothetical protein
MAVEAAAALINGQRVFSNILIDFYFSEVEGGEVQRFTSEPLDMEALYVLDSGVRDCLVCIDEVNLWADSWSTRAVSAQAIVTLFQQIRKRTLSFYLTTQNFTWLNNRLRWQTDLHVACRDFSHGHSGIERGAFVTQRLYDMSGIFTGEPYTEEREYREERRNVVDRMLFGKPFWNIYDSYHEFSQDEYNTKYVRSRDTKVIRNGQVTTMDSPGELAGKAKFMADCMAAENIGNKITMEQMRAYLPTYGIDIDLKQCGRYLKAAGFELKRSRQGNYYSLKDSFLE